MSAVLRHVRKYRPHWHVDLQAEAGRYCIGRGIVNGECYEFGKNPNPDKLIDAEVEILLYDCWCNFHDRPNTRVSSCLRERFGLEWDEECGRYEINVREELVDSARAALYPRDRRRPKFNTPDGRVVAVHYQGDSSQAQKNLSHDQATAICAAVEMLGGTPVILDWRHRSPLEDYRRLRHPQRWGADAEMVCAVISQCAAFVGIDSGPSKCASATNTPTLVVWTGHHPAPFHDPAPNTTHLVPKGYHGLEPVCNDVGVITWFEAHHSVRNYNGNLVAEVYEWLRGVLK